MVDKSILMLARDMGAGTALGPMSVELRKRGYNVLLLAEEGGAAITHLQVPFTHATREFLEELLRQTSPDMIVTGLSTPRHLETWLDTYAVERGIFLVNVEDFWGTHVNSPLTANVVITVDEAAERLVHQNRSASKTFVAGKPGIVEQVSPRLSLLTQFDKIRAEGGKTLVYPDGGNECELSLPRLVSSLLISDPRIILVPRIHPKMRNAKHPIYRGSWFDWCENEMKPLRETGRILDVDGLIEETVAVADGVVSCYGTPILQAAVWGKVAITLWDEVIAQQLKHETGLDKTPLMLHGGFPLLTYVRSIDEFFSSPPSAIVLKPFDASLACDAIESVMR